MQIRSEWIALRPERLAWHLPPALKPGRCTETERRVAAGVRVTDLRNAQQAVLRHSKLEQWVWLGLALAALELLAVSFWV